ncbi:MAG: 30S ribosomal protein S17 [Coriobacteriales bacterium]|jgi:small subunit ribosomal protein S17|nr:30S ribosomal protein S17 [Coriobacteriales bacterium]
MTEERNSRKVRQGVVVSAAADKTITVLVSSRKPHPVYGKMVNHSKKFHAHDENNECGVGDTVRIMETRPLSKTKRWRLIEIVEKAK